MSDFSEMAELVAQIKEASANIKASDGQLGNPSMRSRQTLTTFISKQAAPAPRAAAATTPPSSANPRRRCAASGTPIACPRTTASRPNNTSQTAVKIDEALAARRGFKQILRHGKLEQLDALECKSLSTFSFGNNSFMLSPERSSRVLSCLVDQGNLSGLIDKISVSGPSVIFLIDDARMGLGAWACEQSCFANNPQPDLQEGLGQLEIKGRAVLTAFFTT